MRQLFAEIKATGYEAVFQYGGITVMLGSVTISIGLVDGGFTTYVQQDLPEGPVFTSTEDLSRDEVLALCLRHKAQLTVPKLVESLLPQASTASADVTIRE
jgi:hypothetical protein